MKLYLTRRFSQFPHALFAAASVLALTFGVLSQTSHAQTALDEIMKNKEIKIGIPTDFHCAGVCCTAGGIWLRRTGDQ